MRRRGVDDHVVGEVRVDDLSRVSLLLSTRTWCSALKLTEIAAR